MPTRLSSALTSAGGLICNPAQSQGRLAILAHHGSYNYQRREVEALNLLVQHYKVMAGKLEYLNRKTTVSQGPVPIKLQGRGGTWSKVVCPDWGLQCPGGASAQPPDADCATINASSKSVQNGNFLIMKWQNFMLLWLWDQVFYGSKN